MGKEAPEIVCTHPSKVSLLIYELQSSETNAIDLPLIMQESLNQLPNNCSIQSKQKYNEIMTKAVKSKNQILFSNSNFEIKRINFLELKKITTNNYMDNWVGDEVKKKIFNKILKNK